MTPGLPIPDVYRTENVDLVKAGCANMAKHVQNAVKFGVPVVVAINKFAYVTLMTELTLVPTLMLSWKPFALLPLKLEPTPQFHHGIGERVD